MGEKTETKAKDATVGDIITGNTTEDGMTETHNGEVVTETETTDEGEDDSDEADD